MTNSSYQTVACKVVQRGLGQSPAKGFFQEPDLLEKYDKYNTEELIFPKGNQIVLF